MPEVAPGPLAGLRVIDCSTVLAGPYCTMLLGDLGADVVKVEPPEGDATRGWGPPWVGGETDGTRTAAYFLAVNRNKRSIRVDLRQPDGAAILRELLADADVVVENFRPGSLARLGFDERRSRPSTRASSIWRSPATALRPGGRPARLRLRHPGDERPDEHHRRGRCRRRQPDQGRGRDQRRRDGDARRRERAGGALGRAGRAAPARRTSPATRCWRAASASTSRCSGSTLASLVNQAQNAFVTGVAPGRRGNAHPNIVPYETFETADGPIAVAVGSERQWRRFFVVLDLPEVAADRRFGTNGGRVEHRAELRPILAARFLERDRAAWLAALETAGVPCGPIQDVVEAFASPEAAALGMTVEQEHPAWGVIRQVGIPFRLSRTPATIRTPPPLLGQDTDEVLAALGRTPAQIAALRRDDVV